MSWWVTAARIACLVAAAAAVGWYYGQPLLGAALALGAMVLFWIFQMRRVQRWLDRPQDSPPAIFGIWGSLLSQIYQQRRRDEELRAQLQSKLDYLRDSLASIRDGVAIVDEHSALRWFNQAAEQLLGLRPDDQGQSLGNLVRVPEFLRYFNKGDYREPLQYCTTGEPRTWLRVEITRFGDGDRLLFVRDITAGIRLDQVRRDFVGNVSHELRTPLTVITGYLGMFLGDREGFAPRYEKPLQQMLQQANRMEHLLDDLLWLTRIESDENREKHAAVDVSTLLDEIRDEMNTAHPGRRLQLEIAEPYRILGDYRQLHSALVNLVVNALKYSPQDSPVIVSCQRTGATLRLAVRDEGIGIDRSHFPRLTERFYRVDDSRSPDTGGTGLGLAIVKHVAAAHGARLEIDSERDRGSTFTLVFPASRLVSVSPPSTALAS